MHKPLVSRIASKSVSKIAARKAVSSQTTDYLRKQGCQACPLSKSSVGCPKMPFKGPTDAAVYVLLSDVSADDLKARKYLVNASILDQALDDEPTRYGVCIRGMPGSLIDPKTPKEIISHCCRQSIVEDIKKTKPKIIIACGMPAVQWCLPGAIGTIYHWRGRIAPTNIDGHHCWVAPVMEPEDIENLKVRLMKIPPQEWKKAFGIDVKRAISRSKKTMTRKVPDAEEISRGIRWVTGAGRDDLDKVIKHLERMAELPLATFDIEATCLRPYTKEAKMLSIAVGTGKEVLAFPVDHPRDSWTVKDRMKMKVALLKFFNAKIKKVGHNTGFDLEWLIYMFGPSFMQYGSWHCSQAQAYILDNRSTLQSLDALCLIHFGFNLKAISNVNRKACIEAKLEDLLKYNALDVKWTHKIFLKQLKLIKKRGLIPIYKMQAKRSTTIAYASNIGIPICQDTVEAFSKSLKKEEEQALANLKEMDCIKLYKKRCGDAFSPSSSPACVILFRDILKIGPSSGKFSADQDALKTFKHPAAKEILRYRKAAKKRSTYIDNMRAGIKNSNIYPDGRLHVSYNSTFTETGRFSTSGPNLNFPKRTGKEPRAIVVPPPGQLIYSYDYGQIEARVAGMASKDKKYCKALWDNFDIHLYWAEQLVKVEPSIIDKYKGTQKEKIKTFRGYVKNQFVFPAIYGSASDSCARNLGIPPRVMQPVYDQFWDEYSTIKKWQNELISFYKKHFYVESLTGRRRYGPISTNMVCNTPVQGPASDIVVDAMDRLSVLAIERDMPCLQPVMNIHDDLTFFLPKRKPEKYQEIIVREMLDVPFDWVNVPISIEGERGENWCDMKPIGVYSSDKDL